MYGFEGVLLNWPKDSRRITICIVYLSLLLDNVMLTMVVPIMPDFLISYEKNADQLLEESNNREYQKSYQNVEPQGNETEKEDYKIALGIAFDLNSENGKVGLLLSSKALVQIFLNPLIGVLTTKMGYNLPLFFGTCILMLSATIFAFGGEFITLLLARSLQGVASSCIGITGMCLIAEKYPNEPDRSKMMGFVLGSVAVGVLIGYPFGGFTYNCLGKSAPFLIVVAFICLNAGIITHQILYFHLLTPTCTTFCIFTALQLYSLDLKPAEENYYRSAGWLRLLVDKKILLTGGAIGISTSTIAILEPCLPIWLLKEIKPKKWQLGTAFIPDSLGYVIGTNTVGAVAYQIGRLKIALPALVLVGLSAFLVPAAKSMLQLVIPHFLLGFGVGAVDAALVPLLAALVDSRYSAHYGTVYAMQQMAVSLAYSLGPLFGGEISRIVGFPWMMRIVGMVNILYSPVLLMLGRFGGVDNLESKQGIVDYHKKSDEYERFSDSDESG